jgi:DNA-binding NarL/FixJ family response regulator
MNQSLGFAMPPLARTDFESSLTAVRTRLDREIFEKLWIEGQNMNLEQAVTLAKQTLESWVEADEAAESLPSSSAPAIAQAALTDLTTREIEVLRLVATGLTNAQVAQELSVVPRTVNAHLTSIYAKIGVTSRSGAIRYALEHDLA